MYVACERRKIVFLMFDGKVYFNIYYDMYIWGMIVFIVVLCVVILFDVVLILFDVVLIF